ncbi:MAG: hypothetical protein P1S60_15465 [Anaerolineae bacterium]|nr:hypothetical protein [Anaerolineae bacterium]
MKAENTPIQVKCMGYRAPGWREDNGDAGVIPQTPINGDTTPEPITLIPYGCSNLRPYLSNTTRYRR